MKSAISLLFLLCTLLPEAAAAVDLPFDGWPENRQERLEEQLRHAADASRPCHEKTTPLRGARQIDVRCQENAHRRWRKLVLRLRHARWQGIPVLRISHAESYSKRDDLTMAIRSGYELQASCARLKPAILTWWAERGFAHGEEMPDGSLHLATEGGSQRLLCRGRHAEYAIFFSE